MIGKGSAFAALLVGLCAASGSVAATLPPPKTLAIDVQQPDIVLVRKDGKKWRKHRKRHRIRHSFRQRHWLGTYEGRRWARLRESDAALSRREARQRMECERGIEIVTDFGFSDVQPTACTGRAFNFNATRDGHPYSVTLNPADGELSQVKKLKAAKLWEGRPD